METSIGPVSPIQPTRETAQPIKEKTNRSINEARRLLQQNNVTGAKALRLYTILNNAEQNLSQGNVVHAQRIARQALRQAESFSENVNPNAANPNAAEKEEESPQVTPPEGAVTNNENEEEEKENAPLQERETTGYRDGSSDNGISYQTETPLTPEQAPFAVRQHELSHIRRETTDAILNGQWVMASAAVHSRVDPRTGERSIDGGRARIIIMPDIEPPDPPGENLDVKG